MAATPTSFNAYAQTSYAGVAGPNDSVYYYCGCPAVNYGSGCSGSNVFIINDGMFYINSWHKLAEVTDGTSNTMYFAETARFKNDPDQVFNTWSRTLYFGSALSGVTRMMGFATTGPKPNANLLVPQPAGQWPPSSWLTSGLAINFGQLGFRSQHPGGINALFGDGSVRFIKETIDLGNLHLNPAAGQGRLGVYRALSTRAGGETISADAY